MYDTHESIPFTVFFSGSDSWKEAKPLCRLWLNMHIKKLRILINVYFCSIWLLLEVSEEHVFIIFCACPQKTKLMNCSKAFIFIFKIYILIFKELK